MFQSLRDQFAAMAPAEVPEWFGHKSAPDRPECAGRFEVTAAMAAWLASDRSARFFQWRWYYADQMVAMRGQEGGPRPAGA